MIGCFSEYSYPYTILYDNENRIDIELLKLILESEKDLYYLFLKNYVFFLHDCSDAIVF